MKNPNLDLSAQERTYLAALFKKYGLRLIPHTGSKGVIHLRAARAGTNSTEVKHVGTKHTFLAMSKEKQEERVKYIRSSFNL